jgi:hypothetical protein
MRPSKKLLLLLVLIMLAGLTGVSNPAQSQEITQQEKLVVFESVGSPT